MHKFRLREFAIVCVFGALCYLVGKQFYIQLDEASIQKEITTIEKIMLATSIYYTDISTSSMVNIDLMTMELHTKEYLEESSLFSRYNDLYWNFISCELPDNATRYIIPDNITENTGLCIYLSPEDSSETYRNSSTSAKFACYIETLIDDSSLVSGDGRGSISMNNGLAARVWDCEKESKDAIGSYLFKVF